jgi:formylglycine-generating enzyme required for sulfatase activity
VRPTPNPVQSRRLRIFLPVFVLVAAAAALALRRPASPFEATVPNPGPPPAHVPEGMVWIPGGEFSMGGDAADAQPVHRVHVDGFFIDATELTHEAFAKFVQATGYVTVAERAPAGFPGAPPGSLVFVKAAQPVPLNDFTKWWRFEPGASWRSDPRARYPAVHLAYDDAVAYARWAGKRLPTEAEWEFAARGGLAGKRYPWGDDLGGAARANTWQGRFPIEDRADDGFAGLAPAGSFAPNGYGLYDVAGNAWEWVADWYRPDTYASLAAGGGVAKNPEGPPSAFDPAEPSVPKRVQRGGSFLCSDQYCSRYQVGLRGKAEPDSSSVHAGVRLVRDP